MFVIIKPGHHFMLDIWRLSDAAILKGTDLIKYFYECAKSAKCSSKLLNMTIGHS
jgi:hypothetical protein